MRSADGGQEVGGILYEARYCASRPQLMQVAVQKSPSGLCRYQTTGIFAAKPFGTTAMHNAVYNFPQYRSRLRRYGKSAAIGVANHREGQGVSDKALPPFHVEPEQSPP